MCGIAGYQGQRLLAPERVAACLALMGRRGPDHAETKSFVSTEGAHTTLLHSRLSIIDLDPRAHQPMGRDGGWIVFNGELYNYIERRDALRAAGAPSAMRSDTEVLLQSIRTFGWNTLDTCEGMWAFAFYDEASGRLSLCRDRFGEKPLYVVATAEGVFFGSEVKFIAALLGCRLPINHDHLWRYLVNGYKALYKQDNAFFKGLTETPSGYVVDYISGHEKLRRSYWRPSLSIDETMSFDTAVQGVRERLIRATEIRLRADVPLAFCMSGGVDSNALIGIARREFGVDVHGFTIVNTDARYEEWDMVEIAVRDLGVRHTAVPVSTQGFLDGLRTLIRQHDAPVYTITYYAQWMLQKAIHDAGYRISVSGTAADELFSGYYDHHLAYFAEIHGDSAAHSAAVAAWERHVRPVVRNPHLSNPRLFVDDPGFRDHIYLGWEGFAAFLKSDWREAFEERPFTNLPLRNRMMNELFHETVPVILHEDDLNAMYYSVENRSPFLDRSLFDFVATIPTRHLVRDGAAKAVLREAVRGFAPDAILDNRHKVGFNAPILDYLDLDDPRVLDFLLDDGPIYDFVDKRKVEALTKRRDLPNSESKFLFNLVNCKMFLEEFA
jgi:asparagine synthase (glutamine-hydrolysing)